MDAPKIFISYRRTDNIAATDRIDDHLCMAFGRKNVYRDIDSFPLGVHFKKHISDDVSKCDVFFAINWKELADRTPASGERFRPLI